MSFYLSLIVIYLSTFTSIVTAAPLCKMVNVCLRPELDSTTDITPTCDPVKFTEFPPSWSYFSYCLAKSHIDHLPDPGINFPVESPINPPAYIVVAHPTSTSVTQYTVPVGFVAPPSASKPVPYPSYCLLPGIECENLPPQPPPPPPPTQPPTQPCGLAACEVVQPPSPSDQPLPPPIPINEKISNPPAGEFREGPDYLTIRIINSLEEALTTSYAQAPECPTPVVGDMQPGTMSSKATAEIAVPTGWSGTISLNKAQYSLNGDETLIEANYVVPHQYSFAVADVDVSYVSVAPLIK